MSDPAPDGTLVIQSSRQKAALILVLCPLMIGGSWWMATAADDVIRRGVGWFGVIFFGVCTLLWIRRAIFPDRMRLSPQGLELRTVMGTQRVAWGDIDRIFVWSHRGSSMASWTLREGAPRGWGASFNRAVGMNIDGSLGAAWPKGADAMAKLLDAWRNRHAG